MKKNTLSTALLAGLVGTVGMVGISNAVNVNPDGIGQALIYPYYTVRDGQVSLMSVVNTADTVKAVKIRYIEGKASQEVLDFNLYLSPYDVWTAAIVDSGNGGAIVVDDQSCTVPDIIGRFDGYQEFRNLQYLGDAAEDDSMDRTREGYVEAIEMAVLTATAAAYATHSSLLYAGGCTSLENDWVDGIFNTAGAAAVTDGGSIFGGMSIIDPEVGSDAAYNALAEQAFSTSAGLHTGPGSLSPSLSSADPASIVFDNGSVVASSWLNGADAVSATIMHDAIMNEWTTETSGGITAYTDWVVNFPTKRFYVPNTGAAASEPFTEELYAYGACEPITINLYDREENTPGGGIDFSPPQVTFGPTLCWETSVVTFNDSDALSSNLSENVITSGVPGANGWMKINFVDPSNILTSDNGDIYYGLPSTGFMVQEWVDSDPATMANYTGLFQHRATRNIVVGP